MNKQITRYRIPPKRAFRALNLGVETDGYIRVVAGFRSAWWAPEPRPEPIFVQARIIRRKSRRDTMENTP